MVLNTFFAIDEHMENVAGDMSDDKQDKGTRWDLRLYSAASNPSELFEPAQKHLMPSRGGQPASK